MLRQGRKWTCSVGIYYVLTKRGFTFSFVRLWFVLRYDKGKTENLGLYKKTMGHVATVFT